MYQIPDAPWIRWAERTGYDEYNQPDDLDDQEEEVEDDD